MSDCSGKTMKKSSPLQNKTLLILLFIVLGASFMAGIAQLFVLRFEKGDIYPAYSSFRADPLGTKALYASLDNLDGVFVKRNYYAFKKLEARKDTALLYLGASVCPCFLSAEDAGQFDRFVREGGRVIISFAGGKKVSYSKKTSHEKTDEAAPEDNAGQGPIDEANTGKTNKGDPEKQAEYPDEQEETPVYLTDLWKFSLEHDETQDMDNLAAHPCSTPAFENASPIDWHSNLYFGALDDHWKVLYQTGDYPVIIERKLGQGSVFMAADSFFLSNEALATHRHTGLLVAMASGTGTMIFDESHFGIQSQSGIAGLMGKYNLQGLLISFIAVILLFVWKNAFYFMPVIQEDADQDIPRHMSARDYASGLTNLLQKNISPKHILPLCVTQWQKTLSLKHPQAIDDAKEMERIRSAAKNKKDPVDGYNTICEILSEKKTL